jgi:hypothetical protein
MELFWDDTVVLVKVSLAEGKEVGHVTFSTDFSPINSFQAIAPLTAFKLLRR